MGRLLASSVLVAGAASPLALGVGTASAGSDVIVSVPSTAGPTQLIGATGEVDTHVSVSSSVTVSGSGTYVINVTTGESVGPGGSGTQAAQMNTGSPNPWACITCTGWALIGRIGSGPWSTIGAGPTTLTGTGELYLAINDNEYRDNSGALTATISLPQTAIDVAFTGTHAVQDQQFSGTLATLSGGTAPYQGTLTVDGAGTPFTTDGPVQLTQTWTQEGSHAVAVQGTDATGAPFSGEGTLVVDDAPLTPSAATVRATEGSTYTGTVATFTDADPKGTAGQFTATIDWGDGSTATPGTVESIGTGFTVTGTHTYAEESRPGAYDVQVHISDSGGATTTANSTASVDDATLTPTVATVTATEGRSFDGVVGTFTDAEPNAPVSDFTAIINWGDASPTTSGTVVAAGSGFEVHGTHVYGDEHTGYPVAVTVLDVGGASTSIASTANVVDAPLSAAGTTVAAAEGVTFTGAVAGFTDANPAATAGDFTATVDWGDGSPSSQGSVTAGTSGFTVTASHTYVEVPYLPWTVRVHITDQGGSVADATSVATVADAPLAAAGLSLTTVEGSPYSGTVATFADNNQFATAADFTATVDWGDGTTPTPATVTQTDVQRFEVTGSHAYAAAAATPRTVVVRILDVDGATVTARGTAAVTDAPLSAAGDSCTAKKGVATSLQVAHVTDGNALASAGDLSATIDWGDRTAPSAGVVTRSASGTFLIGGTHTYKAAKSYTLQVRINDAGGSAATSSAVCTVTK